MDKQKRDSVKAMGVVLSLVEHRQELQDIEDRVKEKGMHACHLIVYHVMIKYAFD